MKFDVRAKRVRFKLSSVSKDRVRLSVFRSLKHIYVQAIDDESNITVASVSTNCKDFDLKCSSKSKEAAEWAGREIGKKLLEKGKKSVFLDRGGYKYHGRVQALAEGARSVGLEF